MTDVRYPCAAATGQRLGVSDPGGQPGERLLTSGGEACNLAAPAYREIDAWCSAYRSGRRRHRCSHAQP
jgi:hypothetical protein